MTNDEIALGNWIIWWAFMGPLVGIVVAAVFYEWRYRYWLKRARE